MEQVKRVCEMLYRSDLPQEKAATLLSEGLTHEEACQFIIDSFSRGWITLFNLGIEE